MQKQLFFLWVLLAADAFAMFSASKGVNIGTNLAKTSSTKLTPTFNQPINNPQFKPPNPPTFNPFNTPTLNPSNARQLHTEFRIPPVTPQELENAEIIRKATDGAHRQVEKALDVVKNQHIPENKQKLEASFGPNVQAAEVEKVLTKMKDGAFVVESASTQPAIDKGVKLAGVPVGRGLDGHPFSDPALIGPNFYLQSEKDQMGTVGHEGSHQIAFTGDHVGPNNKIIPAGDKKTPVVVQNGGYRDHPEFENTKKKSPNMHQNADSYRDLFEKCSRRMAKRALLEDDPVGYYLVKRQSCKLPARTPVIPGTIAPPAKAPATSDATKASGSAKKTTTKAGTASGRKLQRGGTLAPKAARAAEQAAKASKVGAAPAKKDTVAASRKGSAGPVRKAASTSARKAAASGVTRPSTPVKKVPTGNKKVTRRDFE